MEGGLLLSKAAPFTACPKSLCPFIAVPKAGIGTVLLGSEESKKTKCFCYAKVRGGQLGTARGQLGTAGGCSTHCMAAGGSLLPLPGSRSVSSLGRTAWCTC